MNLGEFSAIAAGTTRADFAIHFPGPFLLLGSDQTPPQARELRSLGNDFDAPAIERVLLGRSPACSMVLDDPGVSARHALFRRKALPPLDEWYLYDAGSTNGTYLMGQRMVVQRAYLLESGVALRLGMSAILRFYRAENLHDLMASFETQVDFQAFSEEGLGLFREPEEKPSPRTVRVAKSKELPQDLFPRAIPADSPAGPLEQPPLASFWMHCPPLRQRELSAGSSYIIGRDEEADICLPHANISRQHARLSVSEGRVWFEELGSANGTLIDDFAVQSGARLPLTSSQLVSIGPYQFQISADRSGIGTISEKRRVTRRNLESEENEDFAGSLSEIPIHELLRGAEFNDRSGTLSVEDLLTEGHIVFCHGRIVLARNGALAGLAALESLLGVREGRYTFKSTLELPEDPNMNLSPTELLERYRKRGAAEDFRFWTPG